MSEARDKYLRATYLVSKASGGEWFEFLKAFEEYVVSELVRATGVPVSDVLVALGMNRALLQLREDFVSIDKHAEKLKAR